MSQTNTDRVVGIYYRNLAMNGQSQRLQEIRTATTIHASRYQSTALSRAMLSAYAVKQK